MDSKIQAGQAEPISNLYKDHIGFSALAARFGLCHA